MKNAKTINNHNFYHKLWIVKICMNPQESITFFVITQNLLWDKSQQKLIDNLWGVLALHGSFITDKNLVRSFSFKFTRTVLSQKHSYISKALRGCTNIHHTWLRLSTSHHKFTPGKDKLPRHITLAQKMTKIDAKFFFFKSMCLECRKIRLVVNYVTNFNNMFHSKNCQLGIV